MRHVKQFFFTLTCLLLGMPVAHAQYSSFFNYEDISSITGISSSAVTPPGSDGQVLYNNNGVIAASSPAQYVSTTDQIRATSLNISGSSILGTVSTTGVVSVTELRIANRMRCYATGSLSVQCDQAQGSGATTRLGNAAGLAILTVASSAPDTTTGGIGVGFTVPSSTLHVSGTIQMRGVGVVCTTTNAGAYRDVSTLGTIARCNGTDWVALASTTVTVPASTQ